MAAPDVFDRMLLEANATVLPDGAIYAHAIHEDCPDGKPLVARAYRFCAVRKAGIKILRMGLSTPTRN